MNNDDMSLAAEQANTDELELAKAAAIAAEAQQQATAEIGAAATQEDSGFEFSDSDHELPEPPKVSTALPTEAPTASGAAAAAEDEAASTGLSGIADDLLQPANNEAELENNNSRGGVAKALAVGATMMVGAHLGRKHNITRNSNSSKADKRVNAAAGAATALVGATAFLALYKLASNSSKSCRGELPQGELNDNIYNNTFRPVPTA